MARRRFTDIPQNMQALVTQWGLDPLWETALPKNHTKVSDFPARVGEAGDSASARTIRTFMSSATGCIGTTNAGCGTPISR